MASRPMCQLKYYFSESIQTSGYVAGTKTYINTLTTPTTYYPHQLITPTVHIQRIAVTLQNGQVSAIAKATNCGRKQ
jgi:hypothetical protein